MTTGLSSSELCNVCRSSGFRDFVYLCTNSAGCSNFDDNPFMSLSPAGTSSTKLTEFQFFRQDDDVSGLFDDCARDKPAGDGEILPVAPAAKHSDFQANFYNPRPLTLGVCCNAASSLGSHPGSPPVDISVKGQASSTTVSSSGITFTDASTSDIREVRNLMNSEQGDPTTRREASMLRYREKKKRRRFEKKIRYASRKAYAEARPRIKGRFAKRTETREPTAPAYPQDMLGLEWFHH